MSTRPIQWRPPNKPGRGSRAGFWGPLITGTGTIAGIFTGFALLDLKQRKEARRPRARQIPSLQGFMLRNAVLQLPPQRTRPWTFLTSNFSHAGTLHLAVNMFALSSFGSVVAEDFGANQFAAFYLSAGVASSLTAYLARLRRGSGGRSLGASGAVYACFAATALMHPDAHGAFIFLPGIPIRLGDLLPLLMCLDMAGALLGWRYLDHFGHLGGALFGILYTKYGHSIWDKRDAILTRTGLAKLVA
ncbi:hypothetical protein WJX75_003880 [Coccomyxa subellipsoidea]|uniref:Peptidase S54 rhomboid domain-containing protein n=1 Tax=Coccomyxa subellipsoidea TaxID=248742 RepID=A0ABR2YP98_9CHLO